MTVTPPPPNASGWTDRRAGPRRERWPRFPPALVDPVVRETWLRDLAERLPRRLRTRGRRLLIALVPILQCALAAATAWWVANDLLGHVGPFFAPIAAVISVGVAASGRRLRRSMELVGGVAIGIGIGDVVISWIGTGAWQIGLVVTCAMVLAVLADRGPLVSIQAASSAILVATLTPPGHPADFERMWDALIGGLVGIVVMALAPTSPVRRARRDVARVLDLAAVVLRTTARGLRDGDAETSHLALRTARTSQPPVDEMQGSAVAGRETVRLSPLHWSATGRMQMVSRLVDPLDNAVRTLRVLARRARTAVEDDVHVNPELVRLIEGLAECAQELRAMVLANPGVPPTPADAARRLRRVARAAGGDVVVGASLHEQVLLAMIRSIAVDFLQVAGLSKISALATLPPTVENPAVPPDLDDEDDDGA